MRLFLSFFFCLKRRAQKTLGELPVTLVVVVVAVLFIYQEEKEKKVFCFCFARGCTFPIHRRAAARRPTPSRGI
jgi:hypothetical protein